MSLKKRNKRKKTFISTELLPLVPRPLSFLNFCVAFSLPNLLFSGAFFYTDLHPIKWIATFVPLAVLGTVAGYRLLRYGALSTLFRLDRFAVLWLGLLLYITLQPFWVDIRSMETFYREWFFFASLWLVYLLTCHLVDNNLLRTLLWGAVLGAALSVIFAELQVRRLAEPFPFILSAVQWWHYVANTGQQNMLGLWLAIGGVNALFLLFTATKRTLLVRSTLLCLLVVILKGLIASTSRSGILAFCAGCIMLLIFFFRYIERRHLPRIVAAFLFLFLLASLGFYFTMNKNDWRSRRLFSKMHELVTRVWTIGEEKPWSIFGTRGTIWATSWTMITGHPLSGVGLGQFKWNYLDAQNKMLRRWPHLERGYTLWAHNEFLQWFAESGAVGEVLMVSLWLCWGWVSLLALWKKPDISPEVFWGCAMAALFLVSALVSRAFHRIENAVWLSFAFAMTNRNLLRPLQAFSGARMHIFARALGGCICFFSLAGLLFLFEGTRAERILRLAMQTPNPLSRETLLEKARSSLMVRDQAEKQMAYFLIDLGVAKKDSNLLMQGIEKLAAHCEKQPHIEDLVKLQQWTRKLQITELDKRLSDLTGTNAANAAKER